MFDLIVVGGGPAGTSAAITAARAGAQVLLLERGKFPRHKVCGEFVSAESLALLSSLLSSNHSRLLADAVRISRTRIFIDDAVLQSPISPAAASIARLDLDAGLWDSAMQAGVDCRQQVTVQSMSGTGGFRISCSSAEFEAKSVIDATGRWSNLRSSLKQNGDTKWLGVKAHFCEPAPPQSVDLYFFEGGYCGVQPLGPDRVNACAMVQAARASSLEEVFELHPALRERSRAWKLATEPVTTSPLIFRVPEPVRGPVLLAGDAAAFVDPFVGDGISLALRSGALAGECSAKFARGECSLDTALEDYRRQYEARFGPVFRTSSKIRRMLVWPRLVRRASLFVLQKTPGITQYLVSKTR